MSDTIKPKRFSEDDIRRNGLPDDVFGILHDLCYHHEGRNVWNYVARAQEALRTESSAAPEAKSVRARAFELLRSRYPAVELGRHYTNAEIEFCERAILAEDKLGELEQQRDALQAQLAELRRIADDMRNAATGLCRWIQHTAPEWTSEVQTCLDNTEEACKAFDALAAKDSQEAK